MSPWLMSLIFVKLMVWTSDSVMKDARSTAWQSIVPETRISLEPFQQTSFLTPAECEEIIHSTKEGQLRKARLSGAVTNTVVRSASFCWLDEQNVPWLGNRLAEVSADICRTHFPFELHGFDEGFQLLRYAAGTSGQMGDFYDWHIDIGRSVQTRNRKLSMILQLSDPKQYSGGELEINLNGNICAAATGRGTLVAFPSFALHRVCPVLSGERYSLTAWLHGPAFK